MRYALKVCPYLAAPKYSGRLDDIKIDADKLPDAIVGMLDPTVLPDRPEIFVAVMSIGQEVKPGHAGRPYVRPRKRVRYEYWLKGEQLPEAEGFAIAQRVLAEAPDLRAG
jgi:hypothetical protein